MSKALITISAPKSPRVQASIAFIFALTFLYVAFTFYHSDQQLEADHTLVKGQVVEIKASKNSHVRIVSYMVNKNQYTIRCGFFSELSNASVGDQAEVMVSNADPTDARINAFRDRYLEVVIFGLVGLLFLFIGYRVLNPLNDPLDILFQGNSVKKILLTNGKLFDFKMARIQNDAAQLKFILQSVGIDDLTIATMMERFKLK